MTNRPSFATNPAFAISNRALAFYARPIIALPAMAKQGVLSKGFWRCRHSNLTGTGTNSLCVRNRETEFSRLYLGGLGRRGIRRGQTPSSGIG